MILFIGFVYISLVQWYRQQKRQQMYRSIVTQCLRRSSVLVERVRYVQNGRVDLSPSTLVKSSEGCQTREYLNDGNLIISSIEPKQIVDMHSWTTYRDVHPTNDHWLNGILLLLEADQPADVVEFQKKLQDTPPACRVPVLKHGYPVAWRPGSPFGIVLHCSLDGLVAMCDALGQGHLTVGDNLEICKIMTIQSVGKPHRCLQDGELRGNQMRQRENHSVSLRENSNKVKAVERERSPEHEEIYLDVKMSLSESVTMNGEVCAGIKNSSSDSENSAVTFTDKVSRGSDSRQCTDTSTDTNSVNSTDTNTVNSAEMISVNTTDVKSENNTDMNRTKKNSVNELKSNVNSTDAGCVNELNSAVNSSDTQSQNGEVLVKGRLSKSPVKPPNVIVYCGKKDSTRRFNGVRSSLEQCLNTDCYTIHHLQHADVNDVPWADNSALLVISCESLYDDVAVAFVKFFNDGGRIFSCGSSLDDNFVIREKVRKRIGLSEVDTERWTRLSTLRSPYSYSVDSSKCDDVVINTLAVDRLSGEPLLISVKHKTKPAGVAVLSQLLVERDPVDEVGEPEEFKILKKSNSARLDILKHVLVSLGLDCGQQTPLQLTACVLLTEKQSTKDMFLKSVEPRLKSGLLRSKCVTLEFTDNLSSPVSPQHLPVLTGDTDVTLKYFKEDKYWQNLKTQHIGKILLYTDVIPSTMTLIEGLQFSLPKEAGLIAIAGRQTAGKGRGSNKWLSPVGCAMFSLHVEIPVNSKLGQSVSFLQHIASLAVVHSVCLLPGYQNIDLRLKWPNDIYYGGDVKIGGVLVNSSVMDNIIHAVIGCGFNVDNSNPTMCINDLIQQHNTQYNSTLERCSSEALIARTVTLIEQLIEKFQKEGRESFCHLYYDRWLHSGVKVRLESEGGKEVTVCGLDEFGFLQVQTDDGQTVSVQPNGNTFDMMHNLISIKRK